MSSEIEQFLQLEDLLQDSTALTYNTVSATSLVLYEIIITFPDELRFIWRARWSLVTILYLLTRYFALIFLIICSHVAVSTHLSAEFCGPFGSFQIWGPSVLVPAVDILIMLRIYALYNQNKWIRGVLGVFWLAETAIILSLTGLGFGPNKGAMPNPLPGILPECFPNDPFSVHNLVLGGSIAIGFQSNREENLEFTVLTGPFSNLSGSSIIQIDPAVQTESAFYTAFGNFLSGWHFILLQHFRFNVGYGVCYSATYILVAIFAQTNTAGTPLQGVGVIWLVSIVSITAGRLVLNLRMVHANASNHNSDPNDQSSYGLQMRGISQYNVKPDTNPRPPPPPIIDVYQVPRFSWQV